MFTEQYWKMFFFKVYQTRFRKVPMLLLCLCVELFILFPNLFLPVYTYTYILTPMLYIYQRSYRDCSQSPLTLIFRIGPFICKILIHIRLVNQKWNIKLPRKIVWFIFILLRKMATHFSTKFYQHDRAYIKSVAVR